MYNRYIPADASYTRVTQNVQPQPEREKRPGGSGHVGTPGGNPRPSSGGQGPSGMGGGFRLPSFLTGKDGLGTLFGKKESGGLSGLLKTLRLDDLDTGDILLLLIILYLLVEGDDLELVIALGLVLIMGLGDRETEEEQEKTDL